MFASFTETTLYVKIPETLVGAFKVIVLVDDAVVIVAGVPPSILYVKVYGAVPSAPVKVSTGAVVFLHTASSSAEIAAVNKLGSVIVVSAVLKSHPPLSFTKSA